MGMGDFINLFLTPLGINLIRLPTKGPAELSRTLKTVFFAVNSDDADAEEKLRKYMCELTQLHPGHLNYFARHEHLRLAANSAGSS